MNVKFIHPKLWLGSAEDASSFPGATVCIASPQTCAKATYAVVLYDDEATSYESFVYAMVAAARSIDEALKRCPFVMVHCHAGINRSVSALVHYAVVYRGLNVRQTITSLRRVNKRRRGLPALTNPSFFKYLLRMHS
jgi:protein-tyrosine phosphatase